MTKEDTNGSEDSITISEIKLDIGCGEEDTKKAGFLGVDYYTDAADIKAKMWDLPYEDGQVDEIYSGQALEHVGKFRIIETLKEWFRVLKIGGKLELRVPDLEWACVWWLRHQTILWDMDIIYGNQHHDGEFHKTGFNLKILYDYLVEAGFHVDSMEYDGGTSELFYAEDAVREKVLQRIIVAKAIKIGEQDAG